MNIKAVFFSSILVVLACSMVYAQQEDSASSKADRLDEVVVTALGVKRQSKALTYATQEIRATDLTTVRETNPINSLSGRVAGLQLSRNASGAGGSVKVVLRGNKSTRNNSPLYVIDGMPINNVLGAQATSLFGSSSGGGTGATSGGRDGGDVLSNLNPDDIESISVLKGASAAALYGSQAANGAILITTKSGKKGKPSVVYSTSLTAETPFVLPELQYRYGSGAGDKYSWGNKTSSHDFVKDFFQTGLNWTNNISVSGGGENTQTYFSYSNVMASGILPKNDYSKHTLMFKEGIKLWDKLTLNGNVMLTLQQKSGQPTSGLYQNPLTGLYLFPRGLNFSDYSGNNFEIYSSARSLMAQNWFNININKGLTGDDNQQNPYWIINRTPNRTEVNRLYSALQIKYQIVDALSLQVRGSVDKTFSKYEQKSYATSQATIADPNGRYILENNEYTQYYTDALLTFNKKWSVISLNAMVGGSYRYNYSYTEFFDSKGSGLQLANIFTIQNIKQGSANMYQSIGNRKALGAVFANVEVGYKNYLMLDITGRSDFSSTLPGQSFFYPSVGLSLILSDLFHLPNWVNFLKVRGSYTEVGNDIPAFANYPLNSLYSTTGLSQNTIGPKPGTTLRPERSKAVEVGLDARLFRGVFDLAATWYQNNTYDQYMLIGAPIGSGFTKYAINAGNIRNMGYELILTLRPLQMTSSALHWDMTFNVSQNFNQVVKLSDELVSKQVVLTEPSVNNYAYYIDEGKAYGGIYGKKFDRDAQGRIKLNDDGKPGGASAFELLGNANPNALLGWTNTLTYKGISLSFLFDARIGGKVVSMTQAILSEYGVSKETADARDAGGVKGRFVDKSGKELSQIDARAYYAGVGGRQGVTEAFLYDATNIRLRQVSLGYTFPTALMAKTKIIKSLNISLIARNLFFIYKVAPYDPEIAMSAGSGLQGVDIFSLPSTSNFGFSLSVGF